MKLKSILFAFSLLTVFYISQENVSAASCNLCTASCPFGYSYWKECGGGACGTCQNTGTTWCYNGDNVYEYYLGVICNPMTGTNVQCIRLNQACAAPKPRCYDTGSSASCVECLSNADCTNPAKPICDTSTYTCQAKPITCTTSCIDGTSIGECNSAKDKRCDVTCNLQPDPTCNPVCTFKNDPAKDDASCPDDCTGGCNLDKNVCNSANTCVKSSSKFCGIDNSCSGATECYKSTGECDGSAISTINSQ